MYDYCVSGLITPIVGPAEEYGAGGGAARVNNTTSRADSREQVPPNGVVNRPAAPCQPSYVHACLPGRSDVETENETDP